MYICMRVSKTKRFRGLFLSSREDSPPKKREREREREREKKLFLFLFLLLLLLQKKKERKEQKKERETERQREKKERKFILFMWGRASQIKQECDEMKTRKTLSYSLSLFFSFLVFFSLFSVLSLSNHKKRRGGRDSSCLYTTLFVRRFTTRTTTKYDEKKEKMRARRTKKGIVFIDGTRDVCGVRARDGWIGNDDWRDARVGRGDDATRPRLLR